MSGIGEQLETVFRAHMTQAQRAVTCRLNEFINWRCAPDLLALGVFPNIKEVTESIAAFKAASAICSPKDPDVMAICVGDGNTPRTGALLAFLTQWQVYSVDPRLIPNEKYEKVRRLAVCPNRIEECEFHHEGPVIVVAVHSHAGMAETLRVIRSPEVHVVAMPCCTDLSVPGRAPDKSKADYSVMSPKCDVHSYRHVEPEAA